MVVNMMWVTFIGEIQINFQKQPLEVLCKKSVLRNFAKFIGKHQCQSLFFNKVASVAWISIWTHLQHSVVHAPRFDIYSRHGQYETQSQHGQENRPNQREKKWKDLRWKRAPPPPFLHLLSHHHLVKIPHYRSTMGDED